MTPGEGRPVHYVGVYAVDHFGINLPVNWIIYCNSTKHFYRLDAAALYTDTLATVANTDLTIAGVSSAGWALLGNAGTVDGTNFIGTTDNVPFNIRVNNVKSGRIDIATGATAFGYRAAFTPLTTGSNNTSYGDGAGYSNDAGVNNVFCGFEAGYNHYSNVWTAYPNLIGGSVYIGYRAGYAATKAFSAVIIGNSAGLNNVEPHRAIIIGNEAAISSQGRIIALGDWAGKVYAGDAGIFIGDLCGDTTSTAIDIICIGHASGGNSNYSTVVGCNSGIGVSGDNSMYGYGVGNKTFTGVHNNIFGVYSGYKLTTGAENCLFGRVVAEQLVDGSNNSFYGCISGTNTSSGSNNIGIGFYAGAYNTTESNRLYINSIGRANIAGDRNESIIYGVQDASLANQNLYLNATTHIQGTTLNLSYQSVLGKIAITTVYGAANKTLTITNTALTDNRTATFQNASGTIAYLTDISTYGWSVLGNAGTVDGTNFIGTTDDIPLSFMVNNVKAGRIDNLTGATYNTCFGYQTQNAAAGHVGNSSFGYRASYTLSDGDYNTSNGWQALYAGTTGTGNTGIGADACFYNVTGDYNTAVGYYALIGRTTKSYTGSVGIGAFAGRYSIGNYNIYIGYQAGVSANADTSTNLNNIGIGYQALFSNTTSSSTKNTALGYQALYTQAAIANNIGIGAYAGKYETAGNKLFIDSLDRTSEANGRTLSIIYGVMAAATVNQHLYINANCYISNALTLATITTVGGTAPVANGTYNTGVGPLGNMGTITTKSGLITAVTQAT